MKKQVIITILCLFVYMETWAKVGIGAAGGGLYPGILQSEIHKSNFELGAGYEFFARHKLFQLSDRMNVDAKYSYRKYFSQAYLPFTTDTRFSFDYLVLDLTSTMIQSEQLHFYAGAGIALVNVHANKDFLDVNDSVILPEILTGMAYYFSNFYNVFLDLGWQFGSVKVRNDTIPLTGLRLILGATMFLSE